MDILVVTFTFMYNIFLQQWDELIEEKKEIEEKLKEMEASPPRYIYI